MTPSFGPRRRAAHRRSTYAAVLLLLAPFAACSTDDGEPAAEPPRSPAADPTTDSTDGSDGTDSEADAGPDAESESESTDLPPVRYRVSLPALMREDARGGGLRTTRQLAETDRWTGFAATYQVNGATVSGELLVPKGEGPFPALVLNHGYIDPDVYVLGQGMSREQEWFAAAGFVVLHTDYRGHAGSDPVADRTARAGWSTPATPSALSRRCSGWRTSTPTARRTSAVPWAAA